jgi:hypothetical protein
MKKVLLPGILGGLVVFVWSAISHMLLPIGAMGFKTIPSNEDAVLTAMKSNIQESGLYFMPGHEQGANSGGDEEVRSGADGVSGLSSDWRGGYVAGTIDQTGALRHPVRADRGFHHLDDRGLTHHPRIDGNADGIVLVVGDRLDSLIGWLLAGFLIAWMIQRAEKKAAV